MSSPDLYPFAYIRPEEDDVFTFYWKNLYGSGKIVSSVFSGDEGLVISDQWINNRILHEDYQGRQDYLPFRRSASVRLTAPEVGDFKLTNTILTTSGDTLVRTRMIKVRDRYPYAGAWSIPRGDYASELYRNNG